MPKSASLAARRFKAEKTELTSLCELLNRNLLTNRGQAAAEELDSVTDLTAYAEALWNSDPALPFRRSLTLPSRDLASLRDPRRFAIEFVNKLVNNYAVELFAGPCGRCGRYYVKKRSSQTVYCSKKCGNAATALARTRERLQAERDTKLELVRNALRQWQELRITGDWKSWVADSTGINLRFITRAVTKGDLVPPKKGK